MKLTYLTSQRVQLVLGVTILVTVLSIYSCVPDEDLPLDYFAGPSEYYIEFQSGSFTGKTFNLYSRSLTDDHQFNESNLVQKILSKPLEERLQNTLKTSSFINWAWVADTVTGVFPAIFATDPSVSKSGDLQLIFDNGDEMISFIPKGTPVEITNYGSPQGAIEGKFSFTAPLDYRFNGVSKRENASMFVSFKIKRGPTI